ATCPFSLQVKHLPSFLSWFRVGSSSFFFVDLFVGFAGLFAGFSFGFEDCFDFRGSDEGSRAYGPTFLSFISLSMISAFCLYSLNGKSWNNTIAFLISSCNPRLKLPSIKSEWIRLPRVFSSISFSTINSLTGRFPCLIARYLSIAIWKCSGGMNFSRNFLSNFLQVKDLSPLSKDSNHL